MALANGKVSEKDFLLPSAIGGLYIFDEFKGLTEFKRFKDLPSEIRIQIWNLTVYPRFLCYNLSAVKRTKLKIHDPIPPVLHVCRESRAELISFYKPTNQEGNNIFLNPELDCIIWIRYMGRLTFSDDVRRLKTQPLPAMDNFAVSVKFWNRIVEPNSGHSEVYRRIRMSDIKKLTIVDDDYRNMRWSEIRGKEIRLIKTKPDESYGCAFIEHREGKFQRKSKESLWKKWDVGEEFSKTELPEVHFARVVFE